MSVKSIHIPSTGRTYKFGRRRPSSRPKLRLRNYISHAHLPAPPATMDYSAKAAKSLAELYGNDQLGDCVIAMLGHCEGVLTGNAGSELIVPMADIIDEYAAACGFDPSGGMNNNPTDQGCDESAVLDYWKNRGFPAGKHKIVGWIGVDATKPEEYQAALWLFENLCFGVELPDAWVNPMPDVSGFTWDVAGEPDPENGHAFLGVGYDQHGVTISTWGMLGKITVNAMRKYAVSSANGALYSVLSQDMLQQGVQRAPNGVDWDALVQDLQNI